VVRRVDEGENRVEQEAQLVRKALGEYSHGEDVDAALRGFRLILVDEQGPGQQEDADRRADTRRQPLAHLASHACNTSGAIAFLIYADRLREKAIALNLLRAGEKRDASITSRRDSLRPSIWFIPLNSFIFQYLLFSLPFAYRHF
jgi:hypothetical protein